MEFSEFVRSTSASWGASTNGIRTLVLGTDLSVRLGLLGTSNEIPLPTSKILEYNSDTSVTIDLNWDGTPTQLQSNRVDNQDVTASVAHRHFYLDSSGKLTLNYLKLTWGEAGSVEHGGFINMISGTLAINWVLFDGSKTTGLHASQGGCIKVNDGKVTIKKSTFEGFRATNGGAMYLAKTSTPMTIEFTTFIDNEADVRFIYCLIQIECVGTVPVT